MFIVPVIRWIWIWFGNQPLNDQDMQDCHVRMTWQ